MDVPSDVLLKFRQYRQQLIRFWVLFYTVKGWKQPGKRTPHYQDHWYANPKKIIEGVFPSVHDEQIGLVGHGGGIAHIGPEEHGQYKRFGWLSHLGGN